MYVAISSALPVLDISFDVCMDASNNARWRTRLLPVPFSFPCVIFDLGMVFCFFLLPKIVPNL